MLSNFFHLTAGWNHNNRLSQQIEQSTAVLLPFFMTKFCNAPSAPLPPTTSNKSLSSSSSAAAESPLDLSLPKRPRIDEASSCSTASDGVIHPLCLVTENSRRRRRVSNDFQTSGDFASSSSSFPPASSSDNDLVIDIIGDETASSSSFTSSAASAPDDAAVDNNNNNNDDDDGQMPSTHDPDFAAKLNIQLAKFKCQVCDKQLLTGHGLKRHMFYHKKPSGSLGGSECSTSFRCEICLATFSCRAGLDYHAVGHSLDGTERLSNRLFKCDSCNELFTGLKLLKRHKITQCIKKKADQ